MKGPDENIFGSGQELQTEQNIKCMHPDFEKASLQLEYQEKEEICH